MRITVQRIDIPKGDPRTYLYAPDDFKPFNVLCEANAFMLGGGDLWTRFAGSGTRGYLEICRKLTGNEPNLSFTAIDVFDDTSVQAKLKELSNAGVPLNKDLPFVKADNLTSTNYRNGLVKVNGIKMHGLYVSTPPNLHLENASLFDNTGVPVVIEKPIVRPWELDDLSKLSKNIYGTDFFVYSSAFQFLLAHKSYIDDLGEITDIYGRCVEPWKVDRPWLLKEEKAGGGLGLDGGVHPLAMIDVFLRELTGSGLEDARINRVFRGRYKEPDPGGSAETYFNVHAEVNGIKIHVDAGKGIGGLEGGGEKIDFPYYGITIVGKKGKLECCIGTQYHDPYIFSSIKDSRPTLVVFKDGGLGYESVIGDFHLSMLGALNRPQTSVSKRVNSAAKAAFNSTKFVAESYKLCPDIDTSLVLGENPVYNNDNNQISGTIYRNLKATHEPPSVKYRVKN